MERLLKMNEKRMSQFMRIAMARLKSRYKNLKQRRAWAAKMYARWMDRNKLN